MLVFKAEIRVIAPAPEDKEMKDIFMQNAEDIIQRGLNAMTVPDWKVTVVELEEEDE